jgi:hypothetical protein
MLEEGGSLFTDVRYGAGIHVFVRQRLGLDLPVISPAPTHDDHQKEDSVYWYLGWSLYNAEHKDFHEAKNLLFKAKKLSENVQVASFLSMRRIIAT